MNYQLGTLQVVSALPCVVDSSESYVTEDSSSEKSCVICSVSDVTSSKGEEESPTEEDLGTEVREEREQNITCSGSNSKTEISEESDSYTACGGESVKETQEKESLSTKVHQNNGWCLSYAGARDFFHKGAKEYTVCEEFFILCNLFKH